MNAGVDTVIWAVGMDVGGIGEVIATSWDGGACEAQEESTNTKMQMSEDNRFDNLRGIAPDYTIQL